MDNLVRIDFEEIDQQWIVTLIDSDRHAIPGEPFPASGHERYSKLQQVLDRVHSLGYRSTHTPYNRVNGTSYRLEVVPLSGEPQ
jgi:hypothetical protein